MARATAALSDKLGRAVVDPLLDAVSQAVRAERQRYARDPFAHVDDGHVWIEDLETGETVRLVAWPHQRELVGEWVDLDRLAKTGDLRFRNVHLDKSRQMGVTWIVAWVCLWALMYHPVSGLAVFPSIADFADSGWTTDSFGGRIRFIADYGTNESEQGGLPDHLRPTLDFTGGNDPNIRNRNLRGAVLSGAGAVASPGRGKRYRYGFLDEFAFHPFGRAAHRSLARALPQGRLYNSTPFGEDNVFAWLRRVRPRGYRFFRLHWSRHPLYGRGKHVAAAVERHKDGTISVVNPGRRGCRLCEGVIAGLDWHPELPRAHRYPGRLTSPWFEEAILEMTDEDVASELEIDYAAALTARVYPEFSEGRHVADVAIPWFESLPTELCIDYGVDTTAGLICQDAPSEYRVIGEFELHDTMPEEVANAIRAELAAIGVPEFYRDPDRTSRWLMVGDPAGEPRQQATGRPLVAEYRAFGFSVVSRTRSISLTIRAVKRLLLGRPKPVVVSPRCTKLIEHAKHNRWPTNRDGERKPGATEPQNDQHNHMMRALAYLAAWKFPPPSAKEAVEVATRRGATYEYGVDRATGRVDPGVDYDMPL